MWHPIVKFDKSTLKKIKENSFNRLKQMLICRVSYWGQWGFLKRIKQTTPCPWNRVCTPTGLVAATNSHNWDHLISQSAQRLLPQQISLFVVCVHWALKKQDLLGSDTRRPLEMKRLNQERIRQQRLFIGFGNLGKKC